MPPFGQPMQGLSPRMRRNPGRGPASHGHRGSISAHEEEPPNDRSRTLQAGSISAHAEEPQRRLSMHGAPRSISAHAEEPSSCACLSDATWVYLRACGGTSDRGQARGSPAGLSPRMRRNLSALINEGCPDGSISAHAEEPPEQAELAWPRRVYLRACGGTRGTGKMRAGLTVYLRACGGTRASGAAIASARVYLRACGGTRATEPTEPRDQGLSPRMRRNLAKVLSDLVGAGSISAHAEEPAKGSYFTCAARVYLRACGGTWSHLAACPGPWGLSPRMRRNLADRRERRCFRGSISAHAEEPDHAHAQLHPGRVYLRACGGTHQALIAIVDGQGLSPRMRRNRTPGTAGP